MSEIENTPNPRHGFLPLWLWWPGQLINILLAIIAYVDDGHHLDFGNAVVLFLIGYLLSQIYGIFIIVRSDQPLGQKTGLCIASVLVVFILDFLLWLLLFRAFAGAYC